MTAIPMTLREALLMGGAVPEVVEGQQITIGYDKGTIVVPAMIRSALKYEPWVGYPDAEPEPRPLNWAMYLDKLPLFAPGYRPVLLGHFLDRFLDRRLAYDTPDDWMIALRRWANLNLPYFNQRYLSAGVPMPLDTVDALLQTNSTSESNSSDEENTTGSRNESDSSNLTQTDRSRAVGSDFPQSMIAGSKDYATDATDSNANTTQNTGGTRESDETGNKTSSSSSDETSSNTTRETGRRATVAALLEEQRLAFLNVDDEVMESAEVLFLGVFDKDEIEPSDYVLNW